MTPSHAGASISIACWRLQVEIAIKDAKEEKERATRRLDSVKQERAEQVADLNAKLEASEKRVVTLGMEFQAEIKKWAGDSHIAIT